VLNGVGVDQVMVWNPDARHNRFFDRGEEVMRNFLPTLPELEPFPLAQLELEYDVDFIGPLSYARIERLLG
jgi:hypothetical protein